MQTVQVDFEETTEWVLSHCRNMAQMIGEPSAGFRHNSLYQLLAHHGRAMKPHTKPLDVLWGVPQHCYHNAHWIVKVRKNYLYAEGLCVTSRVPFPFLHGWIVEEKTGTAHEVTIQDEVPLAYLGLTFTRVYSRAGFISGKKKGCVSLLDAWKDKWPLLHMTDTELSEVIIPAAIHDNDT